jgi:EmrB/QacA subfamily drug resistance transporter
VTAPALAARPVPTVVALLVGTLLGQLDISLVGTAMPDISAELHEVSLYSWVFFGYIGAFTISAPSFGMLADTIGRKSSYLIALTLFAIGSLVCGAASSMEMLVGGRLAQGLGAGGMYVIAQTILGDLFPIEKRARVQSAFGLVGGISAAIGPTAGGLFVTHSSWRWAFLVNLPIAVVAGVVFVRSYLDAAERRKKPVNWLGALLLTATLWAIFAGIRRDHFEPLLIGLGVALAVPFFLHERRSAQPLLPPSLFLTRSFTLGALVLFLCAAVQLTYIAFLPLYLQGVVGLHPSIGGYLLGLPATLAWTVSAFFTGRLIKRAGYKPVLQTGVALVVLCTLAAATAGWLHRQPGGGWGALLLLELNQVMMGMGVGFISTGVMICVQSQAGWSQRGTATAAIQLMKTMGATLGPALLGVLYVTTLRERALAVQPEEFLNQKLVSSLDPSVVATSRAELGEALRTLVIPLIATACAAILPALCFPRKVSTVEDKKPS